MPTDGLTEAEHDALPAAVKRQLQEAQALQEESGNEEGQGQAETLLSQPQAQEAPAVNWQIEYQKQAAVTAEMQRRMMMLEQQAQAQAVQSQAPQARQEAAPNWDNLAEQYPEDLVSVMREMYSKQQAMMAGQQQAQQQVASVGQQQFAQALSSLVPDWQAKNADQGWIKWLGEIDPVSGVQRQQALDTASGKLDAGWVARIFDSYFGQRQAQPEKPNRRKQGLEALAVPGGSRANGATSVDNGISTEKLRELNALIARDPKARSDPKILALVNNLGGSVPVH